VSLRVLDISKVVGTVTTVVFDPVVVTDTSSTDDEVGIFGERLTVFISSFETFVFGEIHYTLEEIRESVAGGIGEGENDVVVCHVHACIIPELQHPSTH